MLSFAVFTLLYISSITCVTVPSIFASHMVLSTSNPNGVLLWGRENVASSVNVYLSANNSTIWTGQSTVVNGLWQVLVPQQKPSHVPHSLALIPSQGAPLVLSDILFGYVYVCSGQSNMQLSVSCTINSTQEAQDANRVGKLGVRLVMLPNAESYCNESVPQTNFTPALPWQLAASQSVWDFSAVCYYFGRQHIEKHPEIPVGLVGSYWGGTRIESWMSPDALKRCGARTAAKSTLLATKAARINRAFERENHVANHVGDLDFQHTQAMRGGLGCAPQGHSELYNAMIYPLLTIPVTGILWYQGESNAGAPVSYAKCFPEMIRQWRSDFTSHANIKASIPFLFVQISSWPNGNSDVIAVQRYAQSLAVKAEPLVAMAVAADIGDPAGPFHPIHPPAKQEVSRRLFLGAQKFIFNDQSTPITGPTPVKYMVDRWNASWGDFHFGTGRVSLCHAMHCFGVRIYFDQPVVIKNSYGRDYGLSSGFQLVSKTGGYPNSQPFAFYGHYDASQMAIQVNITSIFSSDKTEFELQYAWADYPEMTLFNSNGLPVVPFNLSVSLA